MDSSVSPKDEIWFLRVCHHISTGHYMCSKWREVTARGLFLPAIRGSSGHRVTHHLVRFCVPSCLSFPRPFPFSLPKFCVRYFEFLPLVVFTFVRCSVSPLSHLDVDSHVSFLISPPPAPRGRVFGDHRLSCFVSGYDDKSSDCENERRSLFCPLFSPK